MAKLKLNDELQQKLCNAIRAGNYASVAAQYAGIGESTFYHWLAQGEKQQSGRYREFLEAVKKAESDAEIAAVAIIQKHQADNWQAAAWYLERKHYDRWGRKEKIEHSGDVGLNVVRVPAKQTKEEWQQEQSQPDSE